MTLRSPAKKFFFLQKQELFCQTNYQQSHLWDKGPGKNIKVHVNTVVPPDPAIIVPGGVKADNDPSHQGYQDGHSDIGGQSLNLTVI